MVTSGVSHILHMAEAGAYLSSFTSSWLRRAGYPLIKAESAIGRFARANVAASFGAVKKKYRFVGWIAILCTTLIDMYYVIVGGWVLEYAVASSSGKISAPTRRYF